MTRNFTEDPVDDETLDRILKLGIKSPSAGFTQGVDLVVLKAWDLKRYWTVATTQEWRDSTSRKGLLSAPVAVMVTVEPEAYSRRYSLEDKDDERLTSVDSWPVPYWWIDAGIVISQLLLAASDFELGACLLGTFRNEGEIKASFSIPEATRICATVLMGYRKLPDPLSSPSRRPRRPFDEVVHFGRW